jgi:hypothetical protein
MSMTLGSQSTHDCPEQASDEIEQKDERNTEEPRVEPRKELATKASKSAAKKRSADAKKKRKTGGDGAGRTLTSPTGRVSSP